MRDGGVLYALLLLAALRALDGVAGLAAAVVAVGVGFAAVELGHWLLSLRTAEPSGLNDRAWHAPLHILAVHLPHLKSDTC